MSSKTCPTIDKINIRTLQCSSLKIERILAVFELESIFIFAFLVEILFNAKFRGHPAFSNIHANATIICDHLFKATTWLDKKKVCNLFIIWASGVLKDFYKNELRTLLDN